MTTVDRWSMEGIIAAKVNIEAGYVNNPNDLGGPTNFGITQATARENGYTGDMRNLTRQMALDIYKKGWWDRMRLDRILAWNPLLADRMFDFGINAGRANCIKSLQRILNVLNRQGKLYADISADGGIGPATMTALEGFLKARGLDGFNRLMFALTSHQVSYYTEISEKRVQNEEFTYGWYDRVYREMGDYAIKVGVCSK
ncbi:endolysin [Erwinia phage Machina]|uniref:Putative peptidoglycan domain protein n=2 Tax=Machinavirus machina TaxID=2169990 RepID=A0A1B2IDB9_9CAUD|nr:endolysin [Erwinia phage vB_EamM_Huxley]YP_009617086.1 endolysin [Erwinia phage Machina]ANZ49251.1 putative peptidoglycan domain protein [Erwinia phage vB_EamM_Huxley]ANZ49807.1 putative peptidoglycan domain protein [Erwinia phage Machina]